MENKKYYYSKENDKYILNLLDNTKYEISINEEKPYSKLYMKAFSIYDATAFGADMMAILTYNNIKENGISKTFYFMSLDRFLRMYNKFAFLKDRDMIIDEIKKLYTNKELQLRWNFILLHPICFEIENSDIKYRNISDFTEEVISQLEKSNSIPFADDFLELINKYNI